MTEQIGKVTLDYTFYNGQDQYSDGDIENDLLQLIMEEPDVEKILAEDDRWPVLYHFSPVRQNILEWYPFKKDASVLEIGAGCGAISGVLCRNAKHVTSVDLSKRRSLINANRNKEYDNLTIMVGNFNDVVLKEKYDYITLIGVLEYAGYYTDDEHPFEAFLKKISGYLKEDGKDMRDCVLFLQHCGYLDYTTNDTLQILRKEAGLEAMGNANVYLMKTKLVIWLKQNEAYAYQKSIYCVHSPAAL